MFVANNSSSRPALGPLSRDSLPVHVGAVSWARLEATVGFEAEKKTRGTDRSNNPPPLSGGGCRLKRVKDDRQR